MSAISWQLRTGPGFPDFITPWYLRIVPRIDESFQLSRKPLGSQTLTLVTGLRKERGAPWLDPRSMVGLDPLGPGCPSVASRLPALQDNLTFHPRNAKYPCSKLPGFCRQHWWLFTPQQSKHGNRSSIPTTPMEMTPNDRQTTGASPIAPDHPQLVPRIQPPEQSRNAPTPSRLTTGQAAAPASAARVAEARNLGSPENPTFRVKLAHIDVVAGLVQLPKEASENDIRDDVEGSLSQCSPTSASHARSEFVADRTKLRRAHKVVEQGLTVEQRRQVITRPRPCALFSTALSLTRPIDFQLQLKDVRGRRNTRSKNLDKYFDELDHLCSTRHPNPRR